MTLPSRSIKGKVLAKIGLFKERFKLGFTYG
jgi:hypothetical protein